MKIELLARILRSWLLQIFFKRRPRDMVNVIKWAQTQNQDQLAEIGKRLEEKVMPKTSQSKVADNLEKAYHKNDPKELIFWLAYAKFYGFGFTIKEGRKFFKKIEELWPTGHNCKLANAFHFLNASYAQGYTERNNSDQIYNYSALLAEFSQV